jgi:hypothetical protein
MSGARTKDVQMTDPELAEAEDFDTGRPRGVIA